MASHRPADAWGLPESAEGALRVLIVADSYPPDNSGGAAQTTRLVCEGLRAKGVDVLVVTHGRRRGFHEGVLRIASSAAQFMPASLLRAAAVLKRWPADCIELSGQCGGLFLLGARAFSRGLPPSVAVCHGLIRHEMEITRSHRFEAQVFRPTPSDYYFRYVKGPLLLVLERIRGRLATVLAGVSRFSAQEFARFAGRRPEEAVVLHNGVELQDPEHWRGEASAIRARYGLEGRPVVLYAGVFRVFKGIHLLLRALRDLPGVTLLLVGAGRRYEGRLREMARSWGLRERVRFAGWQPRSLLPAFYLSADVVCLPSLHENFPNAVLEAMAVGRPVVATCVGGVPEAIEHGVDGLLVQPGNWEELAQAIDGLLRRPSWARQLGEAARRKVRERFSLEAMVGKRLCLYERLVREASP